MAAAVERHAGDRLCGPLQLRLRQRRRRAVGQCQMVVAQQQRHALDPLQHALQAQPAQFQVLPV
ncbi:hypothetical protein VL21_04380 [Stenotrophomonas maltophilia]|nr:hypothetical protein VL21_04380 [Stenotrophomonas maltophilia]